MSASKRPIQRSILAGLVPFVVLLCVGLSIPSFMVLSSALYERYEADLAHALNGVEAQIDEDDLYNCYVTGKASQKYKDLQAFMNEYVDLYELEYLYCVIPDVENGVMRNVISATSAAERAEGAVDLAIDETSDEYEPATLQRYADLWSKPGISYFEENSGWGAFYTACMPLQTSNGETFAILCADIPIDKLHETVNNYTAISILLIVVISAVFSLLLVFWLRRNVIKPIAALEQSAQKFAESSHDAADPDSILFTPPEISTKNEIESLSAAITSMAANMRAYVQDALSAEERARSAEQEAEGMSAIAYQDALTRVKSKAAFEMVKPTLIDAGESSKFALVMVDMNDLKLVNDTHGHDHGDAYIIGACQRTCEVFKHSPVYRIGGDEFVVVLRGSDFEDREELVETLRNRFRESESDQSREPWDRYSAAVGMAVYDPSVDQGIEDVLRRADDAMYEDKRAHKASS